MNSVQDQQVSRVAKALRHAIDPLLSTLPECEYDLADEFPEYGEEGLAVSVYLAIARQTL